MYKAGALELIYDTGPQNTHNKNIEINPIKNQNSFNTNASGLWWQLKVFFSGEHRFAVL